MKLSVSLPATDVDFLDRYAEEHVLGSRSAAVQRAIRLLRATGLGGAYEAAWAEWGDGGDAELWSVADADGLD